MDVIYYEKGSDMIGLYALGLFLLWLWLTWLLVRLCWRNYKQGNNKQNIVIGLVILAWLAASFWYGGGRKVYYDWQVTQMCAKDGGIQVYETVILPPEKFDKWGLVNFFRTSKGELALGPQYMYKKKKEHIRRGSPELIMRQYKVFRRADRKLLGEITIYSRIGGDIPGPWHPSHYSCSDINKADSNSLIKSIFISSKGD